MEFRSLSKDLETELDKSYKKQNGVFFTPRSIRDHFTKENFTGMTILEPSFGSGEFIWDLIEKGNYGRIVGVELLEHIYSKTLQKEIPSNVHLVCGDFLQLEINEKFDCIIGNPPYKSVSGTKQSKQAYRKQYPQLDGKFDLYILFLLKCLSLLKKGGVLKFIIPTSFMNVASFNRVRIYLLENFTIENVFLFSTNKWLTTTQRCMGLIVRNDKRGNNEKYSICFGDLCLIHTSSSINFLKNYQSYPTLKDKGFSIKTGEIELMFVKDKMTDSPDNPILVHNSNLKNGTLDFNIKRASGRKLYIQTKDHILKEKVILVNRGHGNNGKLSVQIALVNPNDYHNSLVVENHVYKIFDNGQDELHKLYEYMNSSPIKKLITICSGGGGGLTKRFLESLPVSF